MDRPRLYVMFDKAVNPSPGSEQGTQLHPDGPTEGFWEWVESVRQHYDLFIFSSHFTNASTIPRTLDWLRRSWRLRSDTPMPHIRCTYTIDRPWRVIGARVIPYKGWEAMRASALQDQPDEDSGCSYNADA